MINNVWTILVTCAIILSPYLVAGNNVKIIVNNKHEVIEHNHQLIYTTYHQYTFEENAKDGIQKIVIDAGHGGHDPGTSGAHSKEKDIALAIALKFGQKVNQNYSDIEVIYTRDKDVFIPLHERIAIANRNKADLFISIHCNYAGNKSVCGSETFVMGLHRADDNLKVAKRENSVVLMESDYEKNYDGYDPNSPVGHILLSMFQNAFLDKSISFASDIENSLNQRKDYPSRGVKQAGFVVLREATMPSVLVETGFLSNAKEEKYLMSPSGQDELAEKLTLATAKYMNSIKKEETTLYTQVTPSYEPPKKETNNSPVTIQSKEEVTISKPIAEITVEKNNAQTPAPAKKVRTYSAPITEPAVTTSSQPTTSIAEPVYYTIQVGVFSEQKKDFFKKYEDDLGDVIEMKLDHLYKYMIGKFYNKEEAIRACREIKSKGIPDAYVLKLAF